MNEELQVKAYQALFESVWNKEWFAGGFAWKWFPFHEEHLGEDRTEYSPQNKKAELDKVGAVLKNNPEPHNKIIEICPNSIEPIEVIKNKEDILKIKSKYELPGFDNISMGMSNDYNLAIACGSNMIRVGSRIFEG